MSDLNDDRLKAMQVDAETLLALISDEEAEGEVEAGQLLLEDLPAVCEELKAARERIEVLHGALEFYADLALWEKIYGGGGGLADSKVQEDMGGIARDALRAG